MQQDVHDMTARRFAEEFYAALAEGKVLDACVGAGRRRLHEEDNPEWGLPVLYLRAADGRLFDFKASRKVRQAPRRRAGERALGSPP